MPLIRAVDVRDRLSAGGAPATPEAGVGPETFVTALAGSFPDYRDPRILAVRADAKGLSRDDAVALCARHGIDILADNGERVTFWLDLAVVLLARERGILPTA